MTEVVHYMEKCSALSARVKELEADLEQRKRDVATAQHETALHIQTIEKLTAQGWKYQNWWLTSNVELEKVSERCQDLEAEVERLRRKIAEMAAPQMPGPRNRWVEAEAKVVALEAKLAEAEANVDKWRDRALPAEHRLAEAHKELRELQLASWQRVAHHHCDKQIEGLKAKLAAVRKERDVLKQERDAYREVWIGVRPSPASIERARELAEEIWEDPALTGAPAHKAREIARLLSGDE